MPKPSRKTLAQPDSLRLVKTLLPVALVREMDQAILASGGAYAGRDEFITEAIRDRMAEDRVRPQGAGLAPVVMLEEIRGTAQPAPATAFAAPPEGVATLPKAVVSEDLYGLHNRDYPTLWAAASLALIVGARGAPIPWAEFRSSMLEAAWSLGSQLAQLDRERPRGTMKAGIGYPVNREKRESAESRFTEHMLGTVRTDGSPRGPLFALALAGLELAPSMDTPGPKRDRSSSFEPFVAPTTQACELLTTLARIQIGARPPHSDPAWRAFSTHLRSHAASDYKSWMDVLEAIEARTPRAHLADAFRERWPGNAADTNIYGYLSRGREWGLVDAQLTDREYVLTERGVRALQEVGRT